MEIILRYSDFVDVEMWKSIVSQLIPEEKLDGEVVEEIMIQAKLIDSK